MDVQAVSTAIAASLASIDIRNYNYAMDAPAGPLAFVYPEDISTYNADYDGDITATFAVRLLVPAVTAHGGQAFLNSLISTGVARSVVDALHSDETLGGVVTSLRVLGMRRYGIVELPPNASRYYSAELPVEIFARAPAVSAQVVPALLLTVQREGGIGVDANDPALSWTDTALANPSTGRSWLLGYQLDRRVTGTSWPTAPFLTITTGSPISTTYEDTSVSAATSYDYRVRAFDNLIHQGPWSAVVTYAVP